MEASQPTRRNPFVVRSDFRHPVQQQLFNLIKAPFSKLSGLDQLSYMYDEIGPTESPQAFAAHVLRQLRIGYTVAEKDLARLPRTGALVIVANHPSGAAEGMVMVDLLSRVRDDVKILVNEDLVGFDELKEMVITVDISESPGATRRNLRGLREALAWLEAGHTLVTFPAGAVSHLYLRSRRVTDPAWSSSISRLVQRTGAVVSPMHFSCRRHGPLFQVAGMVHPTLRTMLLPRQLLRQRGRSLAVRIGSAIPSSTSQRFADPEMLTRYLRFRTYLLSHRADEVTSKRLQRLRKRAPRSLAPIAPAEPVELLQAEIAALPPEQLLLTTDDRQVCVATADQAPALMREIGRLREETFRAVGEGSGKSRDLDAFDTYYQQLFVWDTQAQALVGAYRLGKVDEIVGAHGVEGLYTASLFDCRPELFQRLGKALELGRSFVQLDYQRSYSSLLMLWKGIGHYVARNPEYHLLFGAVSISNDYHGLSRQFMARYLSECVNDAALAELVKPLRPLRYSKPGDADPADFLPEIADLDEISTWVADLEPDHKGVPILIKHYLKLGGRILAMSVDPAFGNVLDGLIKVDFSQSDRKLLSRYMGKEGLAGFESYLATTNK